MSYRRSYGGPGTGWFNFEYNGWPGFSYRYKEIYRFRVIPGSLYQHCRETVDGFPGFKCFPDRNPDHTTRTTHRFSTSIGETGISAPESVTCKAIHQFINRLSGKTGTFITSHE